ncbi:MAG TPA: PQQ-dependent sugar dehydrogenase, partial [Acidimicrobiia bacterium]
MGRSLPVFLAVILGCTAPQELATTTTTRSVTTSTAPATTTVTETTTAPSTTSTTTLPVLQGLVYEEVARLSFPVQMTALAGAEYSYIATKDGRVWAYDGSSVLEDPVLDITQNVLNRGERGLLSIVIHPDDATRFFAHYTATDGDTVVSEFTMVSSLEIDPVTETTLLRHEQPAANHNGGMLQFGPDGGLYLGLGDGGGSNDRFGNGQNRETLLGGLVRIDVDDPEIEPELFQYGLRNPWRFWID